MSAKPKQAYNEDSIEALEGLEPVKLRPGQFTRTDTPLHIIQEVIDNAVDEALAGYAKNLEVALLPDGYVSISDDGRGIPVGKHKTKGIPTVEVVFTVLYSGGKFKKTSGEAAYSYAGGLHGVGVSVTNALSEILTCEVSREGKCWKIGFENGIVTTPLKKIGVTEATGTKVMVKPNAKYFDSLDMPVGELTELLKSKAVLLPGITVSLVDARDGDPKKTAWTYEKGLPTYLQEITLGEPPLVPPFVSERYATEDYDAFTEGEGAAWAFSWYPVPKTVGKSFVNLIPTPQGGTHEAGLRQALFEAFKAFTEHGGLLPKGVKLKAEDVFKNVCFVLSAKMLDPSFANQTKDALISKDGVKLVDAMVRPEIDAWINHNPAQAKVVAELVIKNALARQRSSNKEERRRYSGVVNLPGKLTDCESSNPAETELFLVEGDSAGGSAKQARDKEYQAILPLKGKILNTWEVEKELLFENEEVENIAIAIGVKPHKRGEDVDLSGIRYHKIVISSDADVDGFHIRVLGITLFYKHFSEVVRNGYLYVAETPLYRIDVEGTGKKKSAKKFYVMDDTELEATVLRLEKEGYKKFQKSRFKGLGEMNPEELWETTMNPDTRRLVKLNAADLGDTDAMMTMLMSKKEPASRRRWMEDNGNKVGD